MYGFTGSVLVARGERVVLDERYGVAERAFDVGSIMKTVVAAAVVTSRLETSAPIGRFFPSLPPERAAITIEQLLLHTSGLPLDVVDGDLMQTVATAPLVARPGQRYSYSNAGYGLLAEIVERATGEPFRTYARRTLLAPAGMTETSFWGEPALPMPRTYAGNSDEELEAVEPLPFWDGRSPMNGKYVFGAAGLITTTRDLLRWRQFLARRLPEVFRERAPGQAYGWNVQRQGTEVSRIDRGGLIQRSSVSLLAIYPREDAILIWTMNKDTGWHEPVTKNFERILAGRPYGIPPAVVAGNDRAAASYADADDRIRVSRDEGDLLIAAEGQRALSLLWSLSNDPRVSRSNAKTTREHPGCQILGTARHPSSKERLQTFVRCGDEVSRVITEGEKVIAQGAGYPASAQRRFRRTGRNRYALYDPRLDLVVTLRITGDRLRLSSGAVTLEFRE